MMASPAWMVTPVPFLPPVRDGWVNGGRTVAHGHGRMVG